MEKSTMHLIDNNVKRLGYKDKSKIFRENIKNSLVPFPQPISETVNGVNYQIIAGFFNIFLHFFFTIVQRLKNTYIMARIVNQKP